MRNAVIRKKRLKVERIIEDFMRMPQRIMVPEPINIWMDESRDFKDPSPSIMENTSRLHSLSM